MKRIVYFLYQWLIWLPLFLAATIATALTVIVGCSLGGERIFSYYPGKWWSRIVCAISLCPVRVAGREKLAARQSYVFIANHQGVFDIFLLYGYLNTPIKWVMKKSLRDIPLVGKACEKAGFIFVDTTSPLAAAKTIRQAERSLKDGASIAIFPEGSRSRTGQLGKFKKGAYQMALDMRLPIVPIAIKGSFQVMSRHTILLTPHRMEILIGDPIPPPEPLPTDPSNPDSLRQTTLQIRTLLDRSREAIAQSLQ
jgi:1-acyl-sn-glycerol-3-phosphate acyltransferase